MGTLLNTATVLTGGVIGITGGRRMPARVHHGLVAILGLFTTVYGVRTALSPAFTGVGAPDLAVVLLSLLVGTALGSAIDIHGLLERFGHAVETRIGGASADGRMARALVTTSLLLSAVTVLVVQGALTAAAYLTRGALDPVLTTAALGAGGILLVAIGIGLLDIRRLRVPDMLPALVAAPLLELAVRSWNIPI
jgi:uncharacterized membrane protein YqgA involved in biofilm formation